MDSLLKVLTQYVSIINSEIIRNEFWSMLPPLIIALLATVIQILVELRLRSAVRSNDETSRSRQRQPNEFNDTLSPDTQLIVKRIDAMGRVGLVQNIGVGAFFYVLGVLTPSFATMVQVVSP